ncbi:hypothetical protein BC940DRAFT_124704 [Gongronella butleri]|nr:hypothetical protein BC940DRAFT_124704 [Gongronella butleri]
MSFIKVAIWHEAMQLVKRVQMGKTSMRKGYCASFSLDVASIFIRFHSMSIDFHGLVIDTIRVILLQYVLDPLLQCNIGLVLWLAGIQDKIRNAQLRRAGDALQQQRRVPVLASNGHKLRLANVDIVVVDAVMPTRVVLGEKRIHIVNAYYRSRATTTVATASLLLLLLPLLTRQAQSRKPPYGVLRQLTLA